MFGQFQIPCYEFLPLCWLHWIPEGCKFAQLHAPWPHIWWEGLVKSENAESWTVIIPNKLRLDIWYIYIHIYCIIVLYTLPPKRIINQEWFCSHCSRLVCYIPKFAGLTHLKSPFELSSHEFPIWNIGDIDSWMSPSIFSQVFPGVLMWIYIDFWSQQGLQISPP